MNSALAALTDKEKQTLRLLLGGYDAKSMARYLGLSVHTVNERLRDARRKLGTSSSREAAHLLGEAEAPTPAALPQLLGDKPLGASPPMISAQPAPHREAGPPRTGWIIGALAMSFALALSAYAALSGTAVTTPAPPAAAAAETAAVEAGRQWLALLDAGDWAGSYAASGSAIRQLNPLAKWTEVQERVRPPLGAMLSRDLVTVNFAPAPPSGYWIVKFRSTYANRASVIETLSLAWEDGRWKVTGIMLD